MLSKILQINRNFITICIIILFAILTYITADIHIYGLNNSISIGSVLAYSVLLIIAIANIAYFRNQYFPFILLLLSFSLYEGINKPEFYIAFVLLGLIQNQLILNIQNGDSIFNAFDLGFFSGFVILFYPPFVVFLFPIWIYYLVLGKVEIVKYFLNILGLITFAITLWVVMATFDLWSIWDEILLKLEPHFIQFDQQDLWLMPVLVVLGLAVIDYIKNLNRHPNDKKLVFFTSMMYILAALAYMVFWGETSKEKYFLLVFPFALVLANYFTFNRNVKVNEICIWIMILSVLLYQFHSYIAWPDFLNNVTF